jgi:hypothetical protein
MPPRRATQRSGIMDRGERDGVWRDLGSELFFLTIAKTFCSNDSFRRFRRFQGTTSPPIIDQKGRKNSDFLRFNFFCLKKGRKVLLFEIPAGRCDQGVLSN